MKDQTDTELIKLIASKVMGWTFFDEPALYGGSSRQGYYIFNDSVTKFVTKHFNPLESDADCMMAWDEFAKKQRADIGRWMDDTNWVWEVCAWEWCEISQEHVIKAISENPDRRRAMCLCMAKAVS